MLLLLTRAPLASQNYVERGRVFRQEYSGSSKTVESEPFDFEITSVLRCEPQ